MEPALRIAVGDARLHAALAAHLAGRFRLLDEDDSSPAGGVGRVIVVAAGYLTPGECAELVAGGAAVVVLAPVPRDAERDQYLAAGASSYVAMTLDRESLVRAIQQAGDSRVAAEPSVLSNPP